MGGDPRDYLFTRRLFLRSLGCIYLAAFLSYWMQADGLVGSQGILPAAKFLEAVSRTQGAEGYYLCPTLFWLCPTDGFLHLLCSGGVVLSLLSLSGLMPPLVFFLLWAFYLSLVRIGGDFYHFQWDILLLETGLLAVFFAPWKLLPARTGEAPPSLLSLLLVRWLLFRLMFESGAVKLLWNDETWWNLTALNYHYQTQPLPTWVGWYAHQLPEWFQKTSVAIMYLLELAVPFFAFLPRRFRLAGFFALAGFQILILLTGNYCFFNALAIVLCIPLADDRLFAKFRWRRRPREAPVESPAGIPERRDPPVKTVLTWAFAALVLVMSVIQLVEMFGSPRIRGRDPAGAAGGWRELAGNLQRWLAPFDPVNSYGLFRVMTTTRPEIIVEGSEDGRNWQAYEFKWKPGDLKRRPGFVEPHQPRLDWQMWFAALRGEGQLAALGRVSQLDGWFQNFLYRLLTGSPPVLSLLEKNPFAEKPPRYLRALLYEYRFTDPATRRETGDWWRREPKGILCPPVSLNNG